MNNKAILFLSILLFLSENSAYSQRHELELGMGTLSNPYISECLGIGKGYRGQLTRYRYSGTYQLNYRFYLKKKYAAGISLAYEKQDQEKSSNYPGMEGYRNIYRDHYFSIMTSHRYYWRQREWINLYAGADLGAYLINRKETRDDFQTGKDEFTQVHLAYQATLFGIRVGRKFGGYAEMGFGYKGMISAGFSYRF